MIIEVLYYEPRTNKLSLPIVDIRFLINSRNFGQFFHQALSI